MKKLVCLVLAALLLLAALPTLALGETKELRVWLPPFGTEETLDKEFWDGQFDKFEAEHDVTIDVSIISWDNYPDKYMAGISSGSGPDVGYMYADMFPDFIEMGAVQDLAPYLTDADRAIYPYLDEGYILGAQYAVPFILGNPRIIYYNKTVLADAGVEAPTEPITWDEFVDICKACTKDTDGDGSIDQWGTMMCWGAKTYGALQQNFTPFLLQAGGQLFDDDGKTATFGSEAGIKAAKFVHDLVYVHNVMSTDCTAMDDPDCVALFNDDKIAFYFAATAQAAQITCDWGYIPCLKDEKTLTMMVADQLVLMADCRDNDLGMELIRYMCSADVQAAFHNTLSAFPPVNVEEPYNDNPAFEELYTQHADMLRTEKPVKSAYKIDEYLWKNMQMVMMDEMTPEEALPEAQDYANSVFAE